MEISAGGRALKGRNGDELNTMETEGQMLQRNAGFNGYETLWYSMTKPIIVTEKTRR